MSLQDDMTKHRIFVQRLAATEAQNIKDYLKKLKDTATIQAASKSVDKQVLRNSIKDLPITLLDNATDVASYEAKFVTKTFNKYFDGIENVSDEVLRQKIADTNMAINTVHVHTTDTIVDVNAKRRSIEVIYKQFANRKADEITQVIKDGIVQGLASSEIIANVNEKIIGLQFSQADTLATTATNYITNMAKEAVIGNNRDIINKEIWIATLDGSCDYCEGLHEQVFDEGDAPEAPAHFNCNCEVIPYVE